MSLSSTSVAPSDGGNKRTPEHAIVRNGRTYSSIQSSKYVLSWETFEGGNHTRTSLLQEDLQLLPGPLQHRVVLQVAAQVNVVPPKQAVPGRPALQPVGPVDTRKGEGLTSDL